jgi:hypothetical protein
MREGASVDQEEKRTKENKVANGDCHEQQKVVKRRKFGDVAEYAEEPNQNGGQVENQSNQKSIGDFVRWIHQIQVNSLHRDELKRNGSGWNEGKVATVDKNENIDKRCKTKLLSLVSSENETINR